jgi:hypothetical protein
MSNKQLYWNCIYANIGFILYWKNGRVENWDGISLIIADSSFHEQRFYLFPFQK